MKSSCWGDSPAATPVLSQRTAPAARWMQSSVFCPPVLCRPRTTSWLAKVQKQLPAEKAQGNTLTRQRLSKGMQKEFALPAEGEKSHVNTLGF